MVVYARTISLVLVRIAERTQKLVYYVSKALEDVETRYSYIEKLALTLFVS